MKFYSASNLIINEDKDPTVEDFSKLLVGIQAIVDQYIDNTDKDEYDEEDVDKALKDIDKSKLDEKQVKIIKQLVKDGIKQSYKDVDVEDKDIDYDKIESEIDKNHKNISESTEDFELLLEWEDEEKKSPLKKFLNKLKDEETQNKIGRGAAFGVIGANLLMYAAEKSSLFGGKSIASILSSIGTKALAIVSNPIFIASAAAVAVAATAIVVHKMKQKRMEKIAAGLKEKISNEEDPDEREKYQRTYDNMMRACFDKNGKPRSNPKMSKISEDDRDEFKIMYNQLKWDKDLKKVGKKAIEDNAWDAKSEKENVDDIEPKKDENKKESDEDNRHDDESGEDEDNKHDDESGEDEDEKDEEGNVVKQEEITDKEGKKVKVTTHTGPRGGKFYWPEGRPKDADHKVYISKDGKVKECLNLKEYLYESFK